MDNELIERAAKACFEKLCPGIRYTEQDKKFYKEAQIEAIKAMREPTEKMLHNTDIIYKSPEYKIIKECYTAMIDAITND